jgi:hypothetical protein
MTVDRDLQLCRLRGSHGPPPSNPSQTSLRFFGGKLQEEKHEKNEEDRQREGEVLSACLGPFCFSILGF